MSYYGLPESQVHLIVVNSADDFTNGWNAMGENGEPIDAVVINTHGSPYRLTDRSVSFYIDQNRIAALANQPVGCLILYGCNAGHFDHKDSNVAAWFALKVCGAPVLASDGTVNGRLLFGYYWSRSNGKFGQYVPDGTRFNQGWLIYQQKDTLTVSASQGKSLTLKQMLKKLQ